MMNRREAIKNVALLMGGAVFAPSITGILNGCQPRSGVNWNPDLFTDSQAALISALAETIMPANNTPGATELGVPPFIEEMVGNVYPEEDREQFIEGIDAFDEIAVERYGRSFADCEPEQQHELAVQLNREALQNNNANRPFILHVKELTLLGYFTSEVGATQVLQHQQTPGVYEACHPLEKVGKTWAV